MNILNQFTLRTLKKNKVRTLVTIIGIILSMAMFTAVTTSIVSIQRYMIDETISTQGKWQGQADGISQKEAEAVKDDDEVEDYTLLSTLGYAKLEDCKNADKPYLFISGLQKNSQEFIALNVTEGRLPKNSSEILLPSHLNTNGGISYEVGDTFTVEVGKRTIDGEELNQNNPYYGEEQEIKEEIIDSTSYTYTVSGICDRPSMEPYTAPGYMAFTLDDGIQADSYSIYFTLKNAKDVNEYLAKNFSGSSATHISLLRYMGVFGSTGINNMMYGMAAILMAIIMFGSISLIYNAFSISISERTKQFGLLKSVGATKKQMRQSVLFEAGVLCLIGIPFGILAGIGGMSITFYCVNNIFKNVINTAEGVSLHAVVSLPAVLIAVFAGALTVFISAIIPAARAVKMPPIQAIMQSADVKIKRKKVKTSWLTYKLLGFEGMIADKNFKRNRKKYRATVLSLFMSIVLFIASSGFTAYLTESFSVMYDEQPYDINWSMNVDEGNDCDTVRSQIEEMSGVDEAAYVVEAAGMTKLPFDVVQEDCLVMMEQKYGEEQVDRKNEEMGIEISFVYVDDVSYKKYLEENNLPLDTYLGKNAKALVWDTVKTWTDDNRIQTFSVFEKTIADNKAMVIKDVTGNRDNVYYSWSDWNTMEQVFYDSNSDENIKFSAEEACVELDYEIGGINVTKQPWFIGDVSYQNKLLVTLPYSAAEVFTEPMLYMEKAAYKVKANDHRIAYEEISTYFSKGGGSSSVVGNIWDNGEEKESSEALILIISIFSYGFIILISLIAIANVFNTISTNVMLRRREIAMLKSVGMTQKSFKKMMNYECIFYGLKGLLLGLPVSFGVIWLIYKAVGNGWNVSFFIPWKSVGIAVVSVFAVVFATMMYAMFKIKDENTVEALRNENL